MRTLVIGYGNSLRGDDGAGPEVARAVARLELPGVEVLEAHQLLPEHAELISRFGRVVFVDASVRSGPPAVTVERVEATADRPRDPHSSDPAALLGLAKWLYDGDPEAWLIEIAGEEFSLREAFSERVAAAIRGAVERVRALCGPGAPGGKTRLRCMIRGMVQGVGFRPHVHRLAKDHALTGWVMNTGEGVMLEVEGEEARVRKFLLRIEPDKPAHAVITGMEPTWLETAGYDRFEIRPSPPGGPRTALILPDIATCTECRREITDPGNRRFAYPFTNCTHCGPRFSIMEGLPYDRARTSMKSFAMCPACREEYEDPENRRFHAQPNACAECGPRLDLVAPGGEVVAAGEEALPQAVATLRDGGIVAVKGIGGFHLMVRADDEAAVRRLRDRKRRGPKPFALMVAGPGEARGLCEVSAMEERLLRSAEAPIVLMHRLPTTPGVAESVAPGAPQLGVILPSNPLHHLLMRALPFPLVATSGNLRDEPICIGNDEALTRLGGMADRFLVHDRAIVRHVDDSIVRVVMGREMVLRRARGYAPLPVPLGDGPAATQPPVLAVGAQLKNTVAIAAAGRIVVSQHLGDLETEAATTAHQGAVTDLQELLDVSPEAVATDLHPDYASTRFAEAMGLPVIRVQHHHAHALACLAENALTGPALAVVWDGTGYGGDGTIWGGEFLLLSDEGFERLAHFRTFPLPGGDAAIREPRRSLAGMLHEVGAFHLIGSRFPAPERLVVERMLARGINIIATSSVGRLIDGFASLLGIRQAVDYEAQAAMELEFAVTGDESAVMPVPVRGEHPPWRIDWEPSLHRIAERFAAGEPGGSLAAAIHRVLVASIVEVAQRADQPTVLLSGGCFQNRVLLEGAVTALRKEGFAPCWHQRIPTNDGGISCGQAVAAWREGRSRSPV